MLQQSPPQLIISRKNRPAPAVRRGVLVAIARHPSSKPLVATLLVGLLLTSFPVSIQAGDILRGGATTGASARRNTEARANAGAEAAAAAQVRAQDRLARTTQAINAVRTMQAAARAAAGTGLVPNGLAPGGLEVATGPNARWIGAGTPTQSGNNVNITQTQQQALLNWQSFNVGRDTTLNFDQSAGGADVGKWIAFNQVVGSVAPSQILGRINAQGQVYVLNQNGIIFGGGSQINTRTLVAATLPINDNLVRQGLLNNRDAQFLFSGFDVPGGSDGTPAFIVPSPPPGGIYGDVTVEPGATITSPTSADGNGGRVMLVGANVHQGGTITTPAGQTILAAGLQVGVQAHRQDDPSLRGLDVWVGKVGTYAGSVVNSGIIASQGGSIVAVGRQIDQNGILDSSTSVTLNGRIDLLASYGAVLNPNYDRTPGLTLPPFLSQFTGDVRFGGNSVSRILPDTASDKKIPGISLPEKSQINVEGFTIRVGGSSILLAPSGNVTLRAGIWPYKDADGNGSTLDGLGNDENFLSVNLTSGAQKFLLSGGLVYFDAGSLVDVSGAAGTGVALAQSIVSVQMRGGELADSPLQRKSRVRGLDLKVNLAKSGVFQGRQWVGTPLGDLTGLAGIVERTAPELSAAGGALRIESGEAVFIARGATLDVSGGYVLQGGGRVQTSRLLRGNRIIPIEDARPDILYDGVYDGMGSYVHEKWGAIDTFLHPLAPLGGYTQKDRVEGAVGGLLEINSPTMKIAGDLFGRTIQGPAQLQAPPTGGSLKIAFRGEKILTLPIGDPAPSSITFLRHSPYPQNVVFENDRNVPAVPAFDLADAQPRPSVTENTFVSSSLFRPDEGGFANLEIENFEGTFSIPEASVVELPVGGALVLQGANFAVNGRVNAPSSAISFTALNFSPYLLRELRASGLLDNQPVPLPILGRGIITLGAESSINVSGVIADDRLTSSRQSFSPRLVDGGVIKLEGYSVDLQRGSELNVSGGAWIRPPKAPLYGSGGSISVLAGKDPQFSAIVGGLLNLDGDLLGFSVRKGGSLALQAQLIQIGGTAPSNALGLDTAFFQQGGFTAYTLTGIGARDTNGFTIPAVSLASGAVLEPKALSWAMTPFDRSARGQMTLKPVLRDEGVRAPTSLTLAALGVDDPFTQNQVEAVGLVSLGAGSRILGDAGSSFKVTGDAILALGEIRAPGGVISLIAADRYRLSNQEETALPFAIPTLYLGENTRLSTAGTTLLRPDPYGRRIGAVIAGGSISLAGNIVAEAGAILDVSGTSSTLDLPPLQVSGALASGVPKNAGLNTIPWGQRGRATRVDSNGGLISLKGGQVLYSDATLLGAAGGPSAYGGRLAVSSGNYYTTTAPRTGADINLVVEQNGSALGFFFGGNGPASGLLRDSLSDPSLIGSLIQKPGTGYFSLSRFVAGGFDSLDLGYVYTQTAAPIPFGGNVEFRGPIQLDARGFVRVAGGGVIRANAPVSIRAQYVALGQDFRPPPHPADSVQPFRKFDGIVSSTHNFSPTGGAGSLNVNASLVDIGTLGLLGIGQASLSAGAGDIRGNGTLSMVGNLTLDAAQVYPTTLAKFDIFAYDNGLLKSTVQVRSSGTPTSPLSGGGSLSIFASNILQHGVLLAPLGSITLGWDGQDLDLNDGDLDMPHDAIAGSLRITPTTDVLELGPKSITSVAGLDPTTGANLLIPFGLSPDGLSWIDPRGVNVTVSGLPQKKVSLSANSVTSQAGSLVDVRGGGDFFAYRWLAGNGGSVDLLGEATSDWSNSARYTAGDLVRFGGRTWSARVATPLVGVPTAPRENRFWAPVAESYAILPGYSKPFAPYAAFNTTENSSSLGGAPGYISGTLGLGDRISLDGNLAVAPGDYTLLPRRYALLPGAFLVTPLSPFPIVSARREDSATLISGYRFNGLQQISTPNTLRSAYEITPQSVLTGRASYDTFLATPFLRTAAQRLEVQILQPLPSDAGRVVFQANTTMQLRGGLAVSSLAGSRGASVEIGGGSDIALLGPNGVPPVTAGIVLQTSTLQSWGAERLIIGGVSRETATGTVVDTRARNLTLDNAGSSLTGAEIFLFAKESLTMTAGSSISATGSPSVGSTALTVIGDGAAVGVSGSQEVSLSRIGLAGSLLPLLTVGAGAQISGNSVVLDSTYGSAIDETTSILADHISLGSGQIALLLAPQFGPLAGALVPQQLVIDGALLAQAQGARTLKLSSYRSLDLYGAGTFGSNGLEQLVISSAGIRAFNQGAGVAQFTADKVVLGNPLNVAPVAAPLALPSGSLVVNADTVELAAGDFQVSGYASNLINASGGLLATGSGVLASNGALTVQAPVITGANGIVYTMRSTGALTLAAAATPVSVVGGLAASLTFEGSSVDVATTITAPSGRVQVLASTGAINVAGTINTDGEVRRFYDSDRFSDGGEILLTSQLGSINLANTSRLSVSGAAGGGAAGSISISTPLGAFSSLGQLVGRGAPGNAGGSFTLDTSSLPAFATLATELNAGGFSERRDFRIRTGNVLLNGDSTARHFALTADQGAITVTGAIRANGQTGGSILLSARDGLTLASGSLLDASAARFSSAGRGGQISLQAGAQSNGTVNLAAFLDLQSGSTVRLGVADYVAGAYTTPFSSAFFGRFEGTLHLRAPRNIGNSDLNMSSLSTQITGASAIIAEGYRLLDLTSTGGLITGWRTAIAALPTAGTVQRTIYDSANAFLSAPNHAAMLSRLLGADPQSLTSALVIAPGVEIINRTGNLTIGLTNATSLGTAALNSADWNLSDFRFGPRQAPGILTLRARGDVVFNNALSDGFNPAVASSANGNSQLWVGQLRNVASTLPTNVQSWSYNITAGSDLLASGAFRVLTPSMLGTSGSVIVGQFYSAVPTSGGTATGSSGTTANTLRISTTPADLGTRFEVVRTGTGSINVNAGRDVQLRNQFASIYTAGVRIPIPQDVFAAGDFRAPTFFFNSDPLLPTNLGVPQQFYGQPIVDEGGFNRRIPQWGFAGGDLAVRAAANIGRYSRLDFSGTPIADTSRQIPSNWLYRSGTIDPATGLFGTVTVGNLVAPFLSTTWWVDYSNFFQSFGTLGGGNISLAAGNDVVNADAVLPTTARMSGRNGLVALAPDNAKLLEHGGGDLVVRAGRDVSGGTYYIERGTADIKATGQITTNAARSPSFGILDGSAPLDSKTWLPTTLFVGKAQVSLKGGRDVLVGPIVNPFLLPPGSNNKSWYRTYFSTYAPESAVAISSFGGSVTHRLSVTLPGQTTSQPTLLAWLQTQNVFNEAVPNAAASFYQPWLRLADSQVSNMASTVTIHPPTLRSTAFNGDILISGALNLFPAPLGTLELLASGAVLGLQPTGIGRNGSGNAATAWGTTTINLSDASPASIASVTSPSGVLSAAPFLAQIFTETGSFSGASGSVSAKRSLHDPNLFRSADTQPLRVFAGEGDISGLTLFAAKQSRIHAARDVTDVALYLQNADPGSLSVVSAGRDVLPFNENSELRSIATSSARGNFIVDPARDTTLLRNGVRVSTTALAGDIQINGGGLLQVLAGRNLDLGTGPNFFDGRGRGITSIGNVRNPFLPFQSASLIVMAGVGGLGGQAAMSLLGSTLDFIGLSELIESEAPTNEKEAVVALEAFFELLRKSAAGEPGAASYAAGYKAIETLFAASTTPSQIFTRSRDIRTTSGGNITILAPTGGITMATDIFGNPLAPPGIVTEYGGAVSIFTDQSIDIGQARIFTLRGGDMTIWSSNGDIAAGTAPKTVVTAPPTRVIIDTTSADIQTDLGGLATGGGIGVLASVAGVIPGNVTLIAPRGTVDAGDAGIRATGNITVAAATVLNADNIAAGGTSSGVPSAPTVAAPNIGGLTSGSSTTGAATSAASQVASQARPQPTPEDMAPSAIIVEVLGYGGGEG